MTEFAVEGSLSPEILNNDEDITSPKPHRIKIKVYSNSYSLWGTWKPRILIIENGILSIYEPEHLIEKNRFYLTRHSILENCTSFWYNSNERTLQLQMSITSEDNKSCYYFMFKNLKDKKNTIRSVLNHINHANIIYGINPTDAYLIDSVIPNSERITVARLRTLTEASNNSAVITTATTIIQPPDCKTGYLIKRGQIIQSWNKRFFILDGGILSYYRTMKDDETTNHHETPIDLKGSLKLWNFKVSLSTFPGNIYFNICLFLFYRICFAGKITLSTDSDNSLPDTKPFILLLYSDEEPALIDRIHRRWVQAIKLHILYGQYLIKQHRKSVKLALQPTKIVEENENGAETENDNDSEYEIRNRNKTQDIIDNDNEDDNENEINNDNNGNNHSKKVISNELEESMVRETMSRIETRIVFVTDDEDDDNNDDESDNDSVYENQLNDVNNELKSKTRKQSISKMKETETEIEK